LAVPGKFAVAQLAAAVLITLLLLDWPATAQSASLRGPASGFFYDAPSRSVRPLVGFPGSSYLGKVILGDLDNAFIAPDGKSALGIENGRPILIRGFVEGAPTSRSLLAGLTPFGVSTWADSSILLAYSPSTRLLLRWDLSISPEEPSQSFDLSYLEGDVTSIVTNKDASLMVIGLRHPDHGGLYLSKPGVPAVRLLAAKNPPPAIFNPSVNILYTVDGENHRILRFPEGLSGGSEAVIFSGESEPLTDPVALGVSADGQRLFVAGGSDHLVREYDLRSQEFLREVRVEAIPQSLSPLPSMATVFLLGTRGSREPAWLLDTRNGLSVYFAPATE
jgi:hypothetical protein